MARQRHVDRDDEAKALARIKSRLSSGLPPLRDLAAVEKHARHALDALRAFDSEGVEFDISLAVDLHGEMKRLQHLRQPPADPTRAKATPGIERSDLAPCRLRQDLADMLSAVRSIQEQEAAGRPDGKTKDIERKRMVHAFLDAYLDEVGVPPAQTEGSDGVATLQEILNACGLGGGDPRSMLRAAISDLNIDPVFKARKSP